MPRDLKYRLRFYATTGGKRPVRDFLRALPPKHRKKCRRYLDLIRVYGLQQPDDIAEKIKGVENLWEVKPEYENNEYRFLVGIIDADASLLGVVDALKKKRRRLSQNVFDTAAERIKRMQSAHE